MLRQLHDHHSITKAVGRLFHSIAISSQLNAAPYLRHKPLQLLVHVLREETVPAVLNSRFHVCTSHAPGPMTVVFGLGTRLRVRMRTTFENGVLRNGQQPSIGVRGVNQRWNKLDSSMLKSKNQVTLFINYSYNSFYDFRFSENTHREQKIMCQDMGFLNLYGNYIWTYL